MRLSILNPLYDLVAWVIRQIYAVLSPLLGKSSGLTWVLTIVILVMLMRLVMVPLFIKQMHSMRAMTALAPKAQELRKKFKNDKQKLNEETMKMYREAGVNPLMGCLPLVLQLPIFFALFGVLRVIAEPKVHGHLQSLYHLTVPLIQDAQKAKIFGATIADKFLFQHPVPPSFQARAVILGTVLISMLTTYLTMRQNVKRGMMPTAQSGNPMGQQQKLMMYIMPFFALTGLYWPFGLVLYWVTTNVWTLGQQYVLLRKYPVGAAAMPTAGGAAGGPPVGGRGGAGPSGLRGAISRALTGGQGPAAGGGAGPAGLAVDGVPAKPPARGSSPGAGKTAGAGKTPGAADANGSRPGARRKPAAPAARPAKAGYNAPPPSGGGLLRRLSKARAEAVPETGPERPAAKMVRQQRQRQPRSKRTGNK